MEEKKLYILAKQKLRKIKQLIKHAIFYGVMNIILFVFIFIYFESLFAFWLIFVIWTIMLIGHYFYVNDVEDLFFGKKWENKKLNEIIKKEAKKNN